MRHGAGAGCGSPTCASGSRYGCKPASLVFILLLAALHSVFFGRGSVLHLKVQHGFRTAQIAVFVDDESVFTGKLSGALRKKYALFGDTIQGTLTREIRVSSGSHRVRVQITSPDGTVQEDSAVQDFLANADHTLLVNARRGNLELSWLDGAAASASSTSGAAAGASWFNRYSTTLLMTIAGSIVSALTGFVIREIPGYLKSRQASQ